MHASRRRHATPGDDAAAQAWLYGSNDALVHEYRDHYESWLGHSGGWQVRGTCATRIPYHAMHACMPSPLQLHAPMPCILSCAHLQSAGCLIGSSPAHHLMFSLPAFNVLHGWLQGPGHVVVMTLDMSRREAWFSVDGCEPRLGFTRLPAAVWPAVSLQSPAAVELWYGGA